MTLQPPAVPAFVISADESRCCGSGNCALTVPEVFDQRDEDGVVTVLDPVPPPEQHERVRIAVERCPTSALSLAEHPDRT
ncbi:MAG TPA: ferredoxin [Streptosporangiaceae bacterium]|jgi:ferredoxin|nr:ferredoxin [Streptosporangiaceae bacterium]